MRNEVPRRLLASLGLAIVWCAGCLNPRPEDFPSMQPTPGEGVGEGSGNGGSGGNVSDPLVPSDDDRNDGPEDEPDFIPAADAGAPEPDAAPEGVDAGSDAN